MKLITRDLTGDDLAFLARYTGKDPQGLTPHVISVWKATKEQVRSRLCSRNSESTTCMCRLGSAPVF